MSNMNETGMNKEKNLNCQFKYKFKKSFRFDRFILII